MADQNKKRRIAIVVFFVIACSSIAVVLNSLQSIGGSEVGISYDVHQKKLGDKVQTTGLHFGTPGFKFIKFPSTFKTINFSNIKCLNKEGVRIGIKERFQYLARPKHLRDIIVRYRNHQTYVKLLRSLALAAIHDSCSAFNTTQFKTQPGLFQENVRTLTAKRFERVSADLKNMLISSIIRPASYESAVSKMERAEENIKIVEAKRPTSLIAANTAKGQAISTARITKQKADAEARVILAQADSNVAGMTATFEAEAASYEAVLKNQKLTVEGLFSFMAVNALKDKGKVSVNLKEPARTQYTLHP